MSAGRPGNNQGKAIVELAIVAPLLLYLSLWGIELTRTVLVRQGAASLSRTVATGAYRSCSAYWRTERSNYQEMAKLQACLQAFRNRLEDTIRQETPGAEIIVGLYRSPDLAPTVDCEQLPLLPGEMLQRTDTRLGEKRKYQSKARLTSGNQVIDGTVSISAASICRSRLAVVAEVFIPHTPFIKITHPMHASDEEVYYNATRL